MFSTNASATQQTNGSTRRRAVAALLVLVIAMGGVLVSAGASDASVSTSRQVALFSGGGNRWMLGSDGQITPIGSSPQLGAGLPGAVSAAATANGAGYWTTTPAGQVSASGAARWFGDLAGITLNHPVVGMASSPSGQGYWLVASDGGIFAFGDTSFHGSTGNLQLNQPIVGMASSPSGQGYWLVARDGGIFAFGDASFHGSTGNLQLNQPIVAMTSTASGDGYWMVARDGGIFAFGLAPFHGSLASHWTEDVVDIVATPTGYAMADSGGRLAEFGATRPGVQPDEWSGPRTSRQAAIAAEIHDRMNRERVARGQEPLLWDLKLEATARSWSIAMTKGGFEHSNVDSTMKSLGGLDRMAENIYRGTVSYADAGSAHNAFMASAEHRHTLLASAYTTAAVGVYCDAQGQLWVTVHFGTPTGHAPAGVRTPTSVGPVVEPDVGGTSC